MRGAKGIVVAFAALCASGALAACGSDSPSAPSNALLNLSLVDGQPIPVWLYMNVNAESGRIVAGTLRTNPDTAATCYFSISLERVLAGNPGASTTTPASGSAPCTWHGSENAIATIALGSPWGTHIYTFAK